MTPINFDGVNVVFGEGQPEYQPLPALKVPNDETGLVVTKWQLSPDELEQIKATGTFYLSVMTFNNPLQPILLTANMPEI